MGVAGSSCPPMRIASPSGHSSAGGKTYRVGPTGCGAASQPAAMVRDSTRAAGEIFLLTIIVRTTIVAGDGRRRCPRTETEAPVCLAGAGSVSRPAGGGGANRGAVGEVPQDHG